LTCAYAAEHGLPQTPADLARLAVITVSGALEAIPIVLWLKSTVPEGRIVTRYHDVPGLLAGLKDGVGVALMSGMMAEAVGLIHCFVPPVGFEAPAWLITTEKLRQEPRIRAFLDFLAGYVAQKKYRKLDATSP
jgi:DNA-binding transcriptional LysR family regulator